MSDHQLATLALSLSFFAAGAQLARTIADVVLVVQRRRQLKRMRRQLQAEFERFTRTIQAFAVDAEEDAPRVH